MDALKAKGVQLFSVSPQTVESNLELVEKLRLKFEILSDVENRFAKALDLVHGFEPELKEIYLGFGADLEKSNGDPSWTLPIPAQMIVGGDHKIASIRYAADYKVRPEPDELLAHFS